MNLVTNVVLLCAIVVSFLLVLLRVAFFTLFERKLIGLIHSRVGPNKVGVAGLIQPILDAVKLLTKVKHTPVEANFLSYNLSPGVSLGISLLIWVTLPGYLGNSAYSLVLFLAIGSVLVIPVLISG